MNAILKIIGSRRNIRVSRCMLGKRHELIVKYYTLTYLLPTRNISEESIRKYQNEINWTEVSKCPLSEDFIREFKDKVRWRYISRHPLSEDFIMEFKNRVDWQFILKHQVI